MNKYIEYVVQKRLNRLKWRKVSVFVCKQNAIRCKKEAEKASLRTGCVNQMKYRIVKETLTTEVLK